jgi:hypothetical protein
MRGSSAFSDRSDALEDRPNDRLGEERMPGSNCDWFMCRHDWRSALDWPQALRKAAAGDAEALKSLREYLQPGAEWYIARYAPGLATESDIPGCIEALVKVVASTDGFDLENLLTVWREIIRDYTQRRVDEVAADILRKST